MCFVILAFGDSERMSVWIIDGSLDLDSPLLLPCDCLRYLRRHVQIANAVDESLCLESCLRMT